MKTFNKKLSTYNFLNYKKYFPYFESRLENLLYPSLRSQSLLSNQNNFWSKAYNVNKIFFIKNFIKVIFILLPRLLYILISIILISSKEKSQGNKIAFLLSRAAGIKDKNLLEDFRFRGLEKSLLKKNIKSIYFIFDNQKIDNKKGKIFLRYRDIYSISKLIYDSNFLIKNKTKAYWIANLKINIIQTKILSIFLKFSNYCFFWDFNYQHYPFFIAGYLNNNNLIGSMHGFHNSEHMPWINPSLIKHLEINHKFCDYKLCASSFLVPIKASNEIRGDFKEFAYNGQNLSLVVVQENQYSENELVNWISRNKIHFEKIYIKFRPDKADSESLIKTFKDFQITWNEYVDTEKNNNENFFFIGQSSTYLLELGNKGEKVIIFNDDKLNWFKNPACEFIDLQYLLSKKVINGNFLKKNLFYCDKKMTFFDLFKSKNLNDLKIAFINHKIFVENKIQILSTLFN